MNANSVQMVDEKNATTLSHFRKIHESHVSFLLLNFLVLRYLICVGMTVA